MAVDRPMATSISRRPLRLLRIAALLGMATIAACARNPPVGSVSVPLIPPGEARIWFYRVYLSSDTLNMTKVTMNGVYAGYAQLGGAFYRDVPPGIYHVEVESYGKDFDQSTNVALVPGQDAYVKIESLDSWSTLVGAGYAAARDTFYARLMLPQTDSIDTSTVVGLRDRALIPPPSSWRAATRQRVLREDFPLQSSLALWKIIELGRVIDKDAVAHRLVWRPIEHQIDQDRIVRLGFGISHARVWPVAAPD